MDEADIRYRVDTHPGAGLDLHEIATYIADDREQPAAARKFVNDFHRHVARLQALPAAYTRASTAPPRPAYKTFFRKTYVVYHEVFEAERVVRVLYVWHGRRGTRPDLSRQGDPLTA